MLKLKNNATALLGASLNSSATTLTLANNGALFPTLTAGEWFPITVISASNPANFEIMRVTARSNNVMTVQRAQEGTSAKAFSAGDIVDLRLTSGALEEGFAKVVNTTGGAQVRFSVANVENGQTRTVYIPDKDIDLDIGSAAQADVVNSFTDTTPNALTMTGWYGLGGGAIKVGDFNSPFLGNVFIGTTIGAVANRPSGVGWAVGLQLSNNLGTSESAQIVIGTSSDTGMHYRSRYNVDGNAYFAWRKVWDSKNLQMSLSGTTLTITTS